MQSDPWTPEEGEQLRALMQQRGMEEPQLARLHAMSIHQVLELFFGVPEGEASCFYSPQIKKHTGKKLIAKLQAYDADDTPT
jgi:hypothetical protein